LASASSPHKVDGQEKTTEAVVPPNANEEKKDKDKGKKKKSVDVPYSRR